MVHVKLQKRPSGNGDYFTYVVTLPRVLIESMDEFKDATALNVTTTKGKLILTPTK